MDYAAHGIQLKRGDGASPESFTGIPGLVSCSLDGIELGMIDVSDHSSVWRKFKAGLIDGGEITVGLNWDPQHAQHQGLRTDQSGRTLRNFQMTWNTSPETQLAFSAYVQSFGAPGEADGKLPLNITLKISGEPSWT